MRLPGIAKSGLIVREPHRQIGFWIRIVVLAAVTMVPVTLELLRIEPPWRLDWFDMLSRTLPREAIKDSPVRVVVLQDAPGGEHLQGTWPRDRLARLLDIIGYSGARAIGVDVPLDGVGIYELVEERAGVGAPLAKSRALAEAFARHPVVASLILHQTSNAAQTVSEPVGAESSKLDDVLQAMPDVPRLPVSVPAHPLIRNSAKAEALQLDDLHSDERLRQLPIVRVQDYGGTAVGAYYAMAVQMVALGQGQPVPKIAPGVLSDHQMQFDNGLRVPMDGQGNLRLHLRKIDPNFLVDGDALILERVDPAQFRDRYVVITTGYGDFVGRVDTALFRHATTGQITAQAIEQILSDRFVYRASWMPFAEVVIFVLLGCFPVFLFARYSPARIIPVCLAAGIAIPTGCAALFAVTGLMVDGLGLVAGLTIVAMFALGTNLVDRDQDYLTANMSLLDARAATARLEGELDVARRIQMSLLPPETAWFSGVLELACHIQPAQEVGGDFYDYVERPDGQVFFSIGDVSGKGVPASLFMALSKSLWKSAALVNEELSALQEQANRDITRDNRDVMFVTGVGCLFDPATRTLRYCGAGHDMPVLARAGQAAVTLDSISGPPLGLDGALDFPSGEVMLQSRDLVCLFTDGLTEAQLRSDVDQGAEFFGVEGVMQAMQQAATDGATAGEALQFVLEHLRRATAGSPQSDDQTILVARFAPEEAAPVDTTKRS